MATATRAPQKPRRPERTQNSSIPRWWAGLHQQAKLIDRLQENGALELSDAADRGVSAVLSNTLSWETIRTLHSAWQAREELTELAPDGYFGAAERREYARWYAERQFATFGGVLTALGIDL